MQSLADTKGLPSAVDAERMVLGAILLDGRRFVEIGLEDDDFSLQAHRRIWFRLCTIAERGEEIDRLTLANELIRFAELESVGGLDALVSLDDGMPHIPNLDGYVRIIREKSALRRIAIQGQRMMNRAIMGEEHPDEILESGLSGLLGIGAQQKAEWQTTEDVIQSHPGGWNALVSPGASGEQVGIGFPWPRVGEVCGGMHPGELVIVAGRPSHGKSALALQIAMHAARQDYGVAYVSLEMTGAALVRRQLTQSAKVDGSRMKAGMMGAGERNRLTEARGWITTLPFHLEASQKRGRTAAAIISSVRHLIAGSKGRGESLKGWLVVIDHMHLVDGPEREERIKYSRIIDAFQRAARDLGAAVMVLAQLSRKCEDEGRAPGMSDLKETSNIEQNADTVMFVYRPELYAKFRGREDLRGIAELIVAKQRDGAVGSVDLAFNGPQTRFDERFMEEA